MVFLKKGLVTASFSALIGLNGMSPSALAYDKVIYHPEGSATMRHSNGGMEEFNPVQLKSYSHGLVESKKAVLNSLPPENLPAFVAPEKKELLDINYPEISVSIEKKGVKYNFTVSFKAYSFDEKHSKYRYAFEVVSPVKVPAELNYGNAQAYSFPTASTIFFEEKSQIPRVVSLGLCTINGVKDNLPDATFQTGGKTYCMRDRAIMQYDNVLPGFLAPIFENPVEVDSNLESH